MIPQNIYHLKKRFKKLHDEYKSTLIKEAECTVFDSPTDAEKWIKLKHAGQSDGVGTVDWNSQQVQRFEERVEGKSSIALQAIKALEKSPIVPSTLKKDLKNIKMTNLSRLLEDPSVRELIGIRIDNGIIISDVDEDEVFKGLMQIANDLLNPEFKVKDIYGKEDRNDYIQKIPKSNRPDTSKKAPRPWELISPTATQSPKRRPKPHPLERNKLIPRSCVLQISNPKVNAIYHEFQRLKIDDVTNAVAVLFRVFIELSMDCYIESNKVKTANINSKLRHKIQEVSSHLEANKLADKYICTGIRKAVNETDGLLGVDTLNAYVHNPNFSPTRSNMITTWDNIQSFMEKVWENIK